MSQQWLGRIEAALFFAGIGLALFGKKRAGAALLALSIASIVGSRI